MIIAALLALTLGILCGAIWFPAGVSESIARASNLVLLLLMLSVGVSVGANKMMLRELRQYNIRIIAIPVGVAAGSLLAGAALAPLLGDSIRAGMAITGGMGWYSLSGIVVTELMGARIGTIAFLSNLLREILAFCLIPVLVRRFGAYSAIAAAGATSEDTTLPVIIRYAGDEVALISVINGMLTSAVVPLLLNTICVSAGYS